ncbi:MAG: DNA (cytosine-5-)-methyltransferase [Verrucomicrobia bacterium]|nr:DNA (cytosine-5-)-methyltransferase [Verrucomicrobiota bacterium]
MKKTTGNSCVTAVSLFSGCGGFDWGAREAGVEILWANDIDPHAAAAYRSVFPEVPFHEGDIKDVAEFPEADILIGCYPCTGFSEAAKRRAAGMNARRDLTENPGNFLYREFIRALRQIRPKLLFVENVRGMLTAEKGWFLERQLDGFRRHGYRVSYQLLSATDFGVAQERKRVFIVGVRRDLEGFIYRFPAPTHGQNGQPPIRVMRDVIGSLQAMVDDDYHRKPFHGHFLTRPRKRSWDDPSYTIVAHAGHVPLHPDGEPMKRVGKDRYVLQGNHNRHLSWRECVAIQGLPQTIKPTGNLMAKYRVVGNAVPPAFGRVLLESVIRGWTKLAG